MKKDYLTKDLALEPLERDMQGKLKGGFGTFSTPSLEAVAASVTVTAGVSVTVVYLGCGCSCGCGCGCTETTTTPSDPQL
jgi:hypothetical protein